MDSKSSSSSGKISSETFDWDNEEEIKENFIKFPLDKWYEIVFEIKSIVKDNVLFEGNLYQSTVNLILKKDVFKGEKFIEENNYISIIYKDSDINNFLKNEFPNILEKESKDINSSELKPDFLVYDIKKEKFFQIIENRNYMMYYKKFEIPNEIDKISILGEIKISKKTAGNQFQKYKLFIKNYKKKYFVLMNVYDTSYKTFFENKKKSDNTPKLDNDIPIIFCYIPKTYLNDCFNKYNEILKLKNYKPIEWGNNNKNLEDKTKILTRINEKKENLKNLQEKKNNLKIEKELFYKGYQNFIDLEKIFINNKINLEEKIKSFEDKKKDLKKLEEDLKKKKEDLEKDKNNLNNDKKDLEKEEEYLIKKQEDLKEEEEYLKKEKENLKKEKENLNKKEENLEKEEKDLKKEIKELEDKIKDF
jgi:hypothetical protein